jgi:hypothetical protein
LAADIQLPDPPSHSDLNPAIADTLNPPLTSEEQANFNNASFVDDNGICATPDRIHQTLQQSLISAFTLFGWPDQDRRSSCMAADKWDPNVNFVVLFLGYRINSRSLHVTWPRYKRIDLHADIQTALQKPREVSPKIVASILGKVRSVGDVAPWGPYLSFSLSDTLKTASRNAFSTHRTWWTRGKIRLSAAVIQDLKFLSEYLLLEEFSPVWSRYLGLLVPRIATCIFLSDASYEGLGGWSPTFKVMWRLTTADLQFFGFDVKLVTALTGEPDPDQAGLHINPLEFIAAIINLWLCLVIIRTQKPCPTGHIIDLFSDNTSALSWLKVTAATKNPLLQPLARFASALLIQASRLTTRIQPKHIPGVINDEADAMSRYRNGQLEFWEDVITQYSHLRTFQICLLPHELLYALADLSSSRPIGGTYDSLTTALLTHDLDFLPPGSNLSTIRSSVQVG